VQCPDLHPVTEPQGKNVVALIAPLKSAKSRLKDKVELVEVTEVVGLHAKFVLLHQAVERIIIEGRSNTLFLKLGLGTIALSGCWQKCGNYFRFASLFERLP
jgi:hypothetical protein